MAGLLHDKSWSRFVYWVPPAYSMIVTLVLLPRLLRAVPRGGDFWAVLNATSLYWPIATGILYLFAFIVSDHFWKLDTQTPCSGHLRRRGAPSGCAESLNGRLLYGGGSCDFPDVRTDHGELQPVDE